MDDAVARWPAPWVRAALDLAVLGSLTEGPRHGYAIAQVLAARGFGLLRGGSLYPVLNRLQESGHLEALWVEGHSGPGRREYALSHAGRRRLTDDLRAWEQLTETLRATSPSEQEASTSRG